MNSRNPSKHWIDLAFADNVALLADTAENTPHLLIGLQESVTFVSLHLNEGKTEYISISIDTEKSIDSSYIKMVDDLKYHGSWIIDSGKDLNTQKTQAWSACVSVCVTAFTQWWLSCLCMCIHA